MKVKNFKETKSLWVKIENHWYQTLDVFFRISPSFDREDSDIATENEVDDVSTTYRTNDEKCHHEHLSCPGDITTLKCAYCSKSMYQTLKKDI